MINGFVIGFLVGILTILIIALIFLTRELKAINMQTKLNIIIGDKLIYKCEQIKEQVKNGTMNDQQAKIELSHIKELSVIWDEIMKIPCEKIAFSFKKIIPENFLNEEQMNMINNEI